MKLSIPNCLLLASFFFSSTLFAVGSGGQPSDNPSATMPPAEVSKSGPAMRGDRLYSKLKFEKAIAAYTAALAKEGDTVYVVQKIGDCYRMLGNYSEAEKWYAKIAEHPKAEVIVKYYYAEMLRRAEKYAEAQRYYMEYERAIPNPQSMSDVVEAADKVPGLKKNSPAWKVELCSFNTAKSEYAPVFYTDGKLLYTSNRSNEKAIYDRWALIKDCRIYVGAVDSGQNATILDFKSKGKTYESTAAINKGGSEVIYSAGSFKRKNTALQVGLRLPFLKMNSVSFKAGEAGEPVSLSFNSDYYSCSHPTLSKDGNLLIFASDKPGGQGGTDLYMSSRNSNGVWSQPKNLGLDINSQFNEKFPYIAEDGTLYFASDIPGGLGGMDIYKTKPEGGKWSKPENLGSPVNSSADDFSFIIDGKNKNGYFASNRWGGAGAEDIYKFAFDESKLDYKVTVRVLDANSVSPLTGATLALDCKTPNPENSLSDAKGQKDYILPGGTTCNVHVMKMGYKSADIELSPKNKNSTVDVSMQLDAMKLQLVVKEKETSVPVRDVSISIANNSNHETQNYVTNEKGMLEVTIPAGDYALTSSDYASISDDISSASLKGSNVINKEYLIPREEMILNVPLSANCFSTVVTVTDLQTREIVLVRPNAQGDVRLTLKLNTSYTIQHDKAIDTINTVGLKPGAQLSGDCKFFVGQKWVMPNIYYDLNKSNIRKDAADELDKLVDLMKRNPTLNIELSSHTDCRSSAKYNLALSAQRALSAVNYIVRKGIKAKRILAAGYGETQLVNGCSCEPNNDSPCTDEQHQANRRTEVKVLKY